MTLEELSQFDGRDGRHAYVAVSGKIYDVTASRLWEHGNHQDLHYAGGDLTEELKKAPHVRALIERFPVVGRLEKKAPAKQTRAPALIWIGALVVILVLYLILR